MKITDVKNIVDGYLKQFPKEKSRLAGLFTHISDHSERDITSRKTSPGHITVSGIVLSPDKTKVLMIDHKTLKKTIQPGGHMEPADEDLRSTAIREVREETGISNLTPLPSDQNLIDISVHPIPANAKKGEPAHLHYDFRYFFIADTEKIVRQEEETDGACWMPLAEFAQLNEEFHLISQKIGDFLNVNQGGIN